MVKRKKDDKKKKANKKPSDLTPQQIARQIANKKYRDNCKQKIRDGNPDQIEKSEECKRRRREKNAELKRKQEIIQTKEKFDPKSGETFNAIIHLTKKDEELVTKLELRKLRKKETDRLRYQKNKKAAIETQKQSPHKKRKSFRKQTTSLKKQKIVKTKKTIISKNAKKGTYDGGSDGYDGDGDYDTEDDDQMEVKE